MHGRLRLTQAKMPDEVQLELLARYTQNTAAMTFHPLATRAILELAYFPINQA